MPLSTDQWNKIKAEREKLEPEQRRTAALEGISDNLRHIYDAISDLRIEVNKAASRLSGGSKF